MQHLKSVRELQLLRNVESVLTFFYDIYVHEAHQEFSPSCHLAEKVEFSLDANEKILSRFRNFWFFKKICNTVRDATECNPDVTSQPQKLCIARYVSAHHWVTTWTSWYQQPFYWNWNTNARGGETVDWSARDEELKKRWRSRSVSSPKSATGQVFAILRALNTMSMFASPSQCITLIPEADNWDPSVSRNACLLCLCRRKSPCFTINGLWTDATIFLPSLPLLRLICLLPFVEGTK